MSPRTIFCFHYNTGYKKNSRIKRLFSEKMRHLFRLRAALYRDIFKADVPAMLHLDVLGRAAVVVLSHHILVANVLPLFFGVA